MLDLINGVIGKDRNSQYFSQGKLRVAGVTVTSGLASTQSFRLGNPAGSGKNILLLKTFFTASTPATFSLNRNGTLTGPTGHTPWNPHFAYPDTTVAVVQSLVGAITGGASLAASIRLAADITVPFEIPVLLVPGQSVCATVTYAAGASSFVGVVYVENP